MSAHISEATKQQRAEIIIRPRIELSAESFAAVMDRLEHPRPATQALLDLMSGNLIEEGR